MKLMTIAPISHVKIAAGPAILAVSPTPKSHADPTCISTAENIKGINPIVLLFSDINFTRKVQLFYCAQIPT
jgi:hypothetical protein